MSELIDRLDAAIEKWDASLKHGTEAQQCFREVEICHMAPELRAELLRLQEERDELIAELNLRINDAAHLDALLEALQVITEQARDGWRDTESSPAYHFERIQDKALDAMANVEGNDGQGER